MTTKQIFFFADIDDIKKVLETIELVENIQYCEAGVMDSIDIPIYSSFTQLPNLGNVDYGDWILNKFYCVLSETEKISKREIHLNKGGVRYAIYQDNNPKSVIFKPGGVFKDNILVAGSIGTISSDLFSINLYTQYFRAIKKEFSKIRQFYIGPNAIIKLREGWRLVTNSNLPSEYDL